MAEPTALHFSGHFAHNHETALPDLAGISHFRQKPGGKNEKEVFMLVSGKQEHPRNP